MSTATRPEFCNGKTGPIPEWDSLSHLRESLIIEPAASDVTSAKALDQFRTTFTLPNGGGTKSGFFASRRTTGGPIRIATVILIASDNATQTEYVLTLEQWRPAADIEPETGVLNSCGQSLGGIVVALPAGKLDINQETGIGEDVITGALRELWEETGYGSKEGTKGDLLTVFPIGARGPKSPGMTNETEYAVYVKLNKTDFSPTEAFPTENGRKSGEIIEMNWLPLNGSLRSCLDRYTLDNGYTIDRQLGWLADGLWIGSMGGKSWVDSQTDC